MRILWLSPTPGLLYENSGTGGYGGSGWIASLQRLFHQYIEEHQLALAFVSKIKSKKQVNEGVIYYPIYDSPLTITQKLKMYYVGYKLYDRERYVEEIREVIADYQPDIIHLFGLESPLATALGRTDVPIVVHLQGLLGPCDNAFFPCGLNKSSFLWPFSMREWIIRNGYIFAKDELHTKAMRESELFKDAKYFMGRTEFDLQVSLLLSPASLYYKVNEALRPEFYKHVGKWKPREGKFIITSTISETVYKGEDLILKTAKLLKEKTNLDFEWRVVGIKASSQFVKFFEHFAKVKSDDVNVQYLGVMNAEQLVNNALESSVYVHPSYIDNSPNSICESQLLGLPVVATNVGGVSTLVEHGKTGSLVPANDPYTLASQIYKLSLDKKISNLYSTNGLEVARSRHDKKQIILSLLEAYSSIIKFK